MKTKQTIAVIGASGNMGAAISKSLSNGNYRILLCSDESEKAQSITEEIKRGNPVADIESINCSHNAAWEADIIILSVPFHVEAEIANRIKEVANQKIVISIAHPLNNAADGTETAPDTSAAEELQKLLPRSKVIKAFNTTFAAGFTTPVSEEKGADVFITGNNEDALHTVSEMLRSVGFNPGIAGDLSVSRKLESR